MNKKIVWLISVAAIVLIFILYQNTDILDSSSSIDIQIELSQDLTDDIQIVSAADHHVQAGSFSGLET